MRPFRPVWRPAVVALGLAAACGHAAPASHPAPSPSPAAARAAAAAVAPAQLTPPAPSLTARTVDVVEDRFGVRLEDPYRWMEGSDNPELNAWLRAQGAAAERYLATLPGREALYQRVRELVISTATVGSAQLAGGRTFYYETAAGEQLPKLMVRGADGKARVLVDPTKLGPEGSHASVNSYAPSPDGRLVAYDLSTGGSEVSAIRVLDVDSGKELPDVIERVWGEFAAAWLPDGKGFFYTQMAAPRPGVDPMLGMSAKLHVLGQPVDRDVLVLGAGTSKAMPVAAEDFAGVWVQPGTTWMLATAGGAHNEIRVAVARLADLDRSGGGATPWKLVADFADSVEGVAVHGDRLYLQTFKDAPNRKIVSVPLAAPALAKARLEIAEDAEAPLVGIAPARDALYARQMVAGRARLLRRPWTAKTATPVKLPLDGWIQDLATDPLRDGVTFDLVGWTTPSTYYAYEVGRGGKVRAIGLGTTSSADFAAIVADEVEAVSADGTRVPLSILHRRDLALDGSHPAMLLGYGGYGISQNPSFNPHNLAWLERGGVIGVAHVRGGGEKGYRWQADGTHDKKMNGIRDFIACAEYLIEAKLTSPGRLVARGGSMGGVLVGRAITERPDLFAAVNIAVGLTNPVRILAAENGANQKVELGDPDTEPGFRSILEMDPYHHVKPATAYPAVLFTVGLNDRRVAPWMTGKMAARLQATTTSGKPVLIRIDADTGHGVGSTRDQLYAERADIWAFFLAVTGDPAFKPTAAAGPAAAP